MIATIAFLIAIGGVTVIAGGLFWVITRLFSLGIKSIKIAAAMFIGTTLLLIPGYYGWVLSFIGILVTLRVLTDIKIQYVGLLAVVGVVLIDFVAGTVVALAR